ncbi:hypothetical protein LCGC14_0765050 [marine sediment metagenome]|uniref:DNA polymerase III beta sliding clamp C-terminal domain-containing protein n=1 Tax=marine sediment metagenome TaxID=412755 RepID=A0A0F9QJU7_9ZZZZ
MDIQVARLREVLGLLKPVILRKTPLPALTYVLFKDGKAVGTNLETMVIVQVPEADIDCLIPYNDVVAMLQYVQGLKTLHIEPKDGKVTMSWADGKSTFGTRDVGEFPNVPEFVPTVEADIDIDTLIPAMYEAMSFAATEDARPVLQAVSLILGDEVAVAAGDGFRMAHKTLPLSFPQESILVVPLGSVKALKLLWDKTPRTPPASDFLIPAIMAKKRASLALDGETGLRFIFGDSTTAIVKLLDGSPPDWLKLMPNKEPVLKASVMGSEMELAVRRVLPVAKMGTNIARLAFNDDTVTVSAKYEGQEVESTVKVLMSQGAPGNVALNATFLLDYLKGKDGVVILSWEGQSSPLLFNHRKNPTVLIMPMMVTEAADEVEPAEEEEAVAAEAEEVEEIKEGAELEAETAELGPDEEVAADEVEPVEEEEAEAAGEPEAEPVAATKPARKKRTKK